MDKTRSVTGEEAQGGKDVLSLLVKANRGEDGKNYLNEDQMSACRRSDSAPTLS